MMGIKHLDRVNANSFHYIYSGNRIRRYLLKFEGMDNNSKYTLQLLNAFIHYLIYVCFVCFIWFPNRVSTIGCWN